MEADDFEPRLATVLADVVDGFVALTSAERLSGGASQETYRVAVDTTDGARLLAMRRRAGGARSGPDVHGPGPAVEARLIEAAREAGVPGPEIHYVLAPDDGLGEGFVMQWLQGETLGARVNRAPELAEIRPSLANECGRILARIHGIDLEATGLTDHLERLTPAEYVEQTWASYRELDTAQPMIDYTARWLLDHLPPAIEPALVHNDFRNGNLMVTPEGVNAVLDWEIAHIGDPMRDLGWICTNSWRFGHRDLPVGGFGTYDDLFAGYEAESDRPVDPDHVRYWEVFGSFWWAVGCLRMADHYRHGPDQTVERPAIGRRSSECQVDCVNLLIPGPVQLVAETAPTDTIDMPRLDELISSVCGFLSEDVMAETGGRTRFLARVAANSLDITLRELALGPSAIAAEHRRLCELFGRDADLDDLRQELIDQLRGGLLPLHQPDLTEHLRATVVNQVAIDQPTYSGFVAAIEP